MLSSGSTNPQANLAGIALTALNSEWIIDTGATNHMCFSLALFSLYSSCSIQVQLRNGSNVQVTHIGTIEFSPHFQLESFFYSFISV